MNVLDCVVIDIKGTPHFLYNKWWVTVSYNCWGSISETKLMFHSEEEALKVGKGYKFSA